VFVGRITQETTDMIFAKFDGKLVETIRFWWKSGSHYVRLWS